jgi:thiol-disulfide isomerase/thioredoxin
VRGVWVIAALLVASSPALADPPPPLEEALARATREHKPLVIEFHAEWCKPCKLFEQQVLSRADVKAALEHVVYVRYDFDEPPGIAIAKQLDVSAVPTLLVLDSLGRVTMRRAGVPSVPELLRMLATASGASESTVQLEAAVEAAPDSIATRQKLARHYRAIGRTQDAIDQLDLIAGHAGGRRDIAAEVAAERDAIVTGEARLADAMSAAETFVETYPDSRLSSSRLAALALSRRVSRERLEELAQAHVDAVGLDDWPDAIRAARIAGADSIAHRSIQTRLARDPKQPVVQLVRAEELVARRELVQAAAALREACGGTGFELWCYSLQQTVAMHHTVPPRLERLRDAAQGYLDTLVELKARRPYGHLDRLADVDEPYGNAIALALATARLECGHLAKRGSMAIVGVFLSKTGARAELNLFARDGGELDDCLERALASAWLPPSAPRTDERLVALILFDTPGPSEPQYRVPPRYGLMPELVVRRGDLETSSFRGDVLVGVRGSRRGGVLVGGALEFGGGDTRDPMYVARAVGGYELRSIRSSRISLALLAGVGISDLGTMAPRALEVPFVPRVHVALGRVRVHVWGELTAVFLGGMRDSSDVFDERGIGTGASFPFAGTRLFLGVAYERRALADAGMFTFGVPLGSLY